MNLLTLTLAITAAITARAETTVERYTTADGLPNNSVYCTLKSGDGMAWIGTWYGLCSFDGATFTPYLHRRHEGTDLPPRKICQMAEDRQERIWIRTTDNRLTLFDKRAESFHDMTAELRARARDVQVIKLKRMADGTILALTADKSLYEAYTDNRGRRHLDLIHDSQQEVAPESRKLRHNVLGETDRFVYWIGRDYTVYALRKSSPRCCLAGIKDLTAVQSFAASPDGAFHYLIGTTVYSSSVKAAAGAKPSACPVGDAQASLICADKQGCLWLVSRGRLVCYSLRLKAPVASRPVDTGAPLLLPATPNWQLRETPTGQAIILSPQGAISIYDYRSRVFTPAEQAIQKIGGQKFFDIRIDADGLLWMASVSAGLYMASATTSLFTFLRPDIFANPTRVQELGIRGLYQQRGGDIWVGRRDSSLYRFDSRLNLKAVYRDTIGRVYHMMEDSRRRLWISTKGHGLLCATTAAGGQLRFTRYIHNPHDRYSLPSNSVYGVTEDSRHRLWVSTYGGGLALMDESGPRTVFHHKDNTFSRYPRYGLYAGVRALVEDSRHRLWAATTDGLMLVKPDYAAPSRTQFVTRQGSRLDWAERDIYSLYRDRKGQVWVAVLGGRLRQIDCSRKFAFRYFGDEARADNTIFGAMTDDARGRLWLATEHGIYSVAPSDSVIRGYDQRASLPQFTAEDNTMITLADGRIAVGCHEGILAFDPDKVAAFRRKTHPVMITGVSVDGRPAQYLDSPVCRGAVRYADSITVAHDQTELVITFSAPCFRGRESLAYRYMLEGYDSQWRHDTSAGSAAYANLKPGSYTFRVALDEATADSSPERRLTITVLPPWWATWWARLIYALIAIAAVWTAVRIALSMIKMKSEIYVNDRLAELKLRFFTNVSHELRTPLTLIKGPIKELRQREKLTPEGDQYLTLIDHNAERMLQLVNQILDFRKVQNGKMRLRLSQADIRQTLERVADEFTLIAREKGVGLHLELPDEPVDAVVDIEKIAAIVRNLLSNALKYTPQDGTVSVALETDTDGSHLTLTVADDGEPIPAGQHEAIFERFSMAPGTSHGGTGIGLALARDYVNMHHGTIKALPQAAGATFVMRLPMRSGEPALADKAATEPFETGSQDILVSTTPASAPAEARELPKPKAQPLSADTRPTLVIIDDNTDLCQLLRLQLAPRYDVHTATNADDGWRAIRQWLPDVIVCDIMMPGTDGIALLRTIRRDLATSHIPVIMLTAKSDPDERTAAIRQGANSFISKPFDRDYLTASIDRLLEARRAYQRLLTGATAPAATPAPDGDSGTEAEAAAAAADTYRQHLEQRDQDFVRNIRSLIEKDIDQPDLSIDNIARDAGISRSAFFKKLKSLTGLAPVDFIKEIRLTRAAQLIETTDDNFTEIAYKTGFRDSGYFGKCFRRKYGYSPKEYRTRSAAGQSGSDTTH